MPEVVLTRGGWVADGRGVGRYVAETDARRVGS